MNNFTLFTPTKIRFGKGQIAKLSSEIPKDAKVLMLYGGGSIKRNGVYEQVLAALDGYDVHEFSGIEPNPAYETLVKAIAYIREHDISYLLAVGGGSGVPEARGELLRWSCACLSDVSGLWVRSALG